MISFFFFFSRSTTFFFFLKMFLFHCGPLASVKFFSFFFFLFFFYVFEDVDESSFSFGCRKKRIYQ